MLTVKLTSKKKKVFYKCFQTHKVKLGQESGEKQAITFSSLIISVKSVRKRGKHEMVATLNRCSISQLASKKQTPGFYVAAFSRNT